jgi:hypothetical protein
MSAWTDADAVVLRHSLTRSEPYKRTKTSVGAEVVEDVGDDVVDRVATVLQTVKDTFGFSFFQDANTGCVHVVDEGRRAHADPVGEGILCVIPCFAERVVFDEFVDKVLVPFVEVSGAEVGVEREVVCVEVWCGWGCPVSRCEMDVFDDMLFSRRLVCVVFLFLLVVDT